MTRPRPDPAAPGIQIGHIGTTRRAAPCCQHGRDTTDNSKESRPITTVARSLLRAVPVPGGRLDVALIAAVALLTLGTAATVLVPGLHVRFVAPSVDLVLDTVTTLVTLSVSVLGWIRFRERGEPVALFQAAAFLVLGIANGVSLVLVTSGLDGQAGMALSAPGQAPLYDFTLARLLAGLLLAAGAAESLRRLPSRRPRTVLFGAAGGMIALIVIVQVAAGALPSLGTVAGPGEGVSSTSLPAATLVGGTVQVVAAALFLLASALSRRLFLRDGSMGDGYLALGLVFAAFAQVHAAMFPSTYTGLVTGGDMLRLAFDVILLLGIQAEAGAALARLREANADLARLGAVEVERAALEERARLSRELHDGLAQDLWLAKLKTARLAVAAGPRAGGDGVLTGELGAVIDSGLAEAQQAVAALRLGRRTRRPAVRAHVPLPGRLRGPLRRSAPSSSATTSCRRSRLACRPS